MKRHTSTLSRSGILAGLLFAGVSLATAGCGDDTNANAPTGSGSSSGDPPVETCESAADCEDNDSCTLDECVAAVDGTTSCTHERDEAACPIACFAVEDCDDGNGCTVDACEGSATLGSACTHALDTAIPGCGDCTVDDDCDDGDACTADSCGPPDDGARECVHEGIPGCDAGCGSDEDCDDDDACTTDVCEVRGEGVTMPSCYNDAISGCSETCNGDGACDLETEGCSCADCEGETACGAGCTAFTVPEFESFDAFFERLITQILGQGDDYLTGMGLDGIEPGTYALMPHANLGDCDATAPCIGVAADDFTVFMESVSGELIIDSVDPPVGRLVNVVVYPRTVDVNNDITVHYDDACGFLAEAVFPTPEPE